MWVNRTGFLALLTLTLAACTPIPPSAPTPAPLVLTPLPTPPPARQMTLLLPDWPETLNPLRGRSWSARVLSGLFLSGLWRLDDHLSLTPELAAELPTRAGGGISADGRTLTIRLRDGLFWSDGQPLTARDVVFTHEQAAAQGLFPHASFVEEVAALDDRTLRVTFTRPFAPWPLLFPFVLPEHALEADPERWSRAPTVGSGPYIFAGEEGGALLFVANPRYWRGRPAVDQVGVLVEANPQARWDRVARGEASITPFLVPEFPPQARPPEGTVLLTSPSGYVETLFFNLDPRRGHPALQETRVRATLAVGLDRERVCSALSARWAVPAETLYSGTVFEAPGAGVPASFRSPARLLEDAGWLDPDRDGIRERAGILLTLRYAAPPGREAAQTVVAQALREMGIGVEVLIVERPWDHPGGWDLAQWAAQPPGYPDPDDPRWLCVEARSGSQNPAGVCDETLDQLFTAQAAATDPDERMTILTEIQVQARENVWWLPLCRWEDIWLTQADPVNVRPWRGMPFWNVGEWDWHLTVPIAP